MLSIRRAFTLLELVVVIIIIAILAAILFPVFPRGNHENPGRSSCQSNLKQVGLGFKQYQQDYNEKFPPASVGNGQGWANVLQPYIRSWQVFHCPTAKSPAGETTDYFYNRRVAQLEDAKIEMVSLTIIGGDGTPESPSNVSISALSQEWRDNSQSPIFRHLEGANYVFADGHVKWMKPEKVTLDSPTKSSNATFLTE